MNEFIIKELYQLLFVMSTIYFSCIVLILTYRFIRRVMYQVNTTMTFNVIDKILLLIALGIIITYLL